jgi:hypothetical protein
MEQIALALYGLIEPLRSPLAASWVAMPRNDIHLALSAFAAFTWLIAMIPNEGSVHNGRHRQWLPGIRRFIRALERGVL